MDNDEQERSETPENPKKPRVSDPDAMETKKVFVGGLSYDATEEDVKAFFADCGDISAIDLERRSDGTVHVCGHAEESVCNI